MTMLDAALSYAGRGWHVLPLKARGKTPLTPHGLKDATQDAATIRAWWQRLPEANIGIACEPSGLAVIDIDAKSGGMVTLDQFTGLDPLCVDTLISRTGGGGAHLYLRAAYRTRQARSARALIHAARVVISSPRRVCMNRATSTGGKMKPPRPSRYRSFGAND